MSAWKSLLSLPALLLLAGLWSAACTAPAAVTTSPPEPVIGSDPAPERQLSCSGHQSPGGHRSASDYAFCASSCEITYRYCTHGVAIFSRPQDPARCAEMREACCDGCDESYP